MGQGAGEGAGAGEGDLPEPAVGIHHDDDLVDIVQDAYVAAFLDQAPQQACSPCAAPVCALAGVGGRERGHEGMAATSGQ
jgi:hypothetical protein